MSTLEALILLEAFRDTHEKHYHVPALNEARTVVYAAAQEIVEMRRVLGTDEA